ncbi:MAG: tetratricopeptide repeat protein, partial [Bacteroidia bacterium]
MRLIFLCLLTAAIAGCGNPPTRNDTALLNSYYMKFISDAKPAQDSLLFYSKILDSLADDRPEIEAMAASGYGTYYKLKGFYRQSHSSYMRADSLAKIAGNDTISARALIGAAQCDWNEGRTDKAIEKNLTALRLSEKQKFERGITGAHISLAQIYQQTDKQDLARSHLQMAMNRGTGNVRDRNYFLAAHTLANLYGMSGKYDSALTIDNELLRELNKPELQKFRSMFYDNKANCYIMLGKYDSSFANYKLSIA